ncbi:hypothetical protein MNBD_BACTEROID05-1035 [hydrothermal vent metagenome]|uniref:Lipoprotein n=1 Tax=hydrothermal vent metagenome TaxID=652676 RepID=A0A3B0TLV5_9ZZZZ
MKSSKVFMLFLMFSLVVLQGCETAKGFKKDVSNLPKVDNWLEENLW